MTETLAGKISTAAIVMVPITARVLHHSTLQNRQTGFVQMFTLNLPSIVRKKCQLKRVHQSISGQKRWYAGDGVPRLGSTIDATAGLCDHKRVYDVLVSRIWPSFLEVLDNSLCFREEVHATCLVLQQWVAHDTLHGATKHTRVRVCKVA